MRNKNGTGLNNLVVRHLNLYVGKERIHCFPVVRPVAINQMQLSWLSGATAIQNNSSLLVIRRTTHIILDFGQRLRFLNGFGLKLVTFWLILHRRPSQNRRMRRKKFNLCNKCGFRHAAPTGKACAAGDGAQSVEKHDNGDESVPGEQGRNQEGLDVHGVVQQSQNAVDIRMTKIEGSVTTLNTKLDLILGKRLLTYKKSNRRKIWWVIGPRTLVRRGRK